MSFKSIITAFLLGLVFQSFGQDTPTYLRAKVVNGDTLAYVQLRETQVYARYEPKTVRDRRKYSRLQHNVARAYPYARIASRLIKEYEHDLSTIDQGNDQNKYMKLAEAELRAEFEAEVKNLTVTQGRILIKLIDRETGNTSYDLIKQLRSGFQAFVWQGVAKVFGTNLKDEYDPHGEDVMIESIVQRIQLGEIAVRKRKPQTAKAQAKLERRKARLYKKYGLSYESTSDAVLK
jgi:hypothetical protein